MKRFTHFSILAFLPLVLSLSTSVGQQDLSLYFTEHIFQSNQFNPSFHPKQTVIAFPSLAFNYGNSGFTYNQLFSKKDGIRTLDINGIISGLSERNVLNTQFSMDLFAVNFRVKSVYVNFRITEKAAFDFNYSGGLADLAWSGNAKFIGEAVEIAPTFDVNFYKEYALGAAYTIGKFTLGQRLKFLSGIAHASSSNEKATFYTDDEYYQTSFETHYSVNTSGFDDFDGALLNPVGGFKNPGIAIDLGANYKPNEDWDISMSLIDAGYIKWKENNKNYFASGSAAFSGLYLNDYISSDDFDFDDYTDSLENRFVTEENNNTFIQNLIPALYIGVQRKINEVHEVGLLSSGRFFRVYRPSITAYYGVTLSEKTKLGTTLSYKNKVLNSPGLSISQMIGNTQLFISSDNIIGTINYKNANNINFRFGVNLLIPVKKERNSDIPEVEKVELI